MTQPPEYLNEPALPPPPKIMGKIAGIFLAILLIAWLAAVMILNVPGVISALTNFASTTKAHFNTIERQFSSPSPGPFSPR